MSVLELLRTHNVKHYPVPGSPKTVITEMVTISSFGGLVEVAARNTTRHGRMFSSVVAGNARDAVARSLASNGNRQTGPVTHLSPLVTAAFLMGLQPAHGSDRIALPTEAVWTSALAGGGLSLMEGHCHHAMTEEAVRTFGQEPSVTLVVEMPEHRRSRRDRKRSGLPSLRPLAAMAQALGAMVTLRTAARNNTLLFNWETDPAYIETVTSNQPLPPPEATGLRLMVRS